jgi:cell wall-associated NlpC family hydrolase
MSKPPAWAAEYIGIPFLERGRDRAGCDCWGLVRLVLAERFGIELPSHACDYDTVKDHGRIAELVGQGRHSQWIAVWSPLSSGLCHLPSAPGDVVLLRLSGLPIHVGLVVARGWMLHVEAKVDSILERFDGLEWRRRVLGIYRHVALRSRRQRTEDR